MCCPSQHFFSHVETEPPLQGYYQFFSGSKCVFAQEHNAAEVGFTTLPHNLIKEKLLDLIERTSYKKEGELYLACNDKNAFFTSKDHHKGYQLWSCQNVCDALSFLLDNIYIRFGNKLYRQIVGNPMGTNCAPLVADLFLFCYERDFMKDLSSDNQADVIKAFNSTSRYLDDLLNIDNPYFEGMVNQRARFTNWLFQPCTLTKIQTQLTILLVIFLLFEYLCNPNIQKDRPKKE